MSPGGTISLRGVEVHNLKRINLDIPRGRLVVLCGLSGSGKSSLAFDTLYAEGQRRYIESFSAYTRQFLERLEKPAAERIEGIPPAIAVCGKSPSRSSRSTVGTVTETTDYLRLLMAKIGQIHCLKCGGPVRQHSPQSIVEELIALPAGLRYSVAFDVPVEGDATREEVLAALREDGFTRGLVAGRMVGLDDPTVDRDAPLVVIVDRLTSGGVPTDRLRDSVELALSRGQGRLSAYVDAAGDIPAGLPVAGAVTIDDRVWQRLVYSTALRCDVCDLDYPQPEPRLFSFNSPLGACPECEGFGNVVDIDFDLVVPDPSKSLRDGAIAPWNTPAYRHELEELLALAKDYDLPVDIPFAQLESQHLELIRNGVPEREFGGLRGFFQWLERRKYKMHIRVFLSRWRSYRPCPSCGGSRLRPEALAATIGGQNLAQLSTMRIRDCLAFFEQLELADWEERLGRVMLDPIRARLGFLSQVGLDYLSLDRTLRTLSGGEAQRVALTSALGSSLVNMLYVLDEPSIGLHPRDTDRLLQAILKLRDRGNSVVVVEHEEAIIRAADQVIEIGPGAGERGGEVVFQGTPTEMAACPTSMTGDFLSGRRAIRTPGKRRTPNHGWIRLAGARGNNLQNLTVEFPLGALCVVAGVSGAGKSTLVQDTLYPALCRRLRKEGPIPAPFDDVFGDGQIDDVQLVDQNPIGRSPRSNPVTYIKAFDEIRHVFAETVDARTRSYTAGHFSFNVEGGRCNVCEGDGFIEIDMQFMADVYMKCAQCGGKRYRPEILDITYRGRNIADVLEMTVREAFTFFRGHPKVQTRLKRLIDVGLDYLRLGQGANTLSGGEAQRLKLAAYMPASTRNRCLFILDEPTTGLHFADVVQLLDCFDALLAVGHSLIVIEHSLPVIRSADYLIELGPGAAEEGGRIVAHGTPELVARNKQSVTGRFLAQAFTDELQEQSA